MNFLSKRKFAAEEVADTEETNKRRKKDRKRATEEEISSYFAPKRPPLAEKSTNEPTLQPTVVRDEIQHIDDLQRQSSTVSSIRPTIEKPAPPELDDRKSGPRSTSNTYFTWSDSLRHSSRPAVIRPASTTDLEAYRASTPLTGKKMRASSYDMRPPDLVDKRRIVRSQTTRDHRNPTSFNTNLLHGDVTTSSSLSRLQQLREPNLERTMSGSNDPPCTAQGSFRGIAEHSLPAAIISPTKAAQQEESTVSNGNRILQTDKSTPALNSQDPTSASIAHLLNDCDTAYLTNTKVRTTRLQPAQFERRAISRSTNDASTIRNPHHIYQNLGEKDAEVEEEDELFDGPDDRFFNNHAPQMEGPPTLEEQYYTYEPGMEEEPLDYMRPDMTNYGEQMQRSQPTIPTRWPRYETHHRPVIQLNFSMGEIPMNDSGEDDDDDEEGEEEASEQLESVEEMEENDGLAGFWKPNMLY